MRPAPDTMLSRRRTFEIAAAVLLAGGIGLGGIPASAADQTVAGGSFEGRSGHTVTGAVAVIRGDDGTRVVLTEDFSLDGAPDPKLGFGRDGYAADTQFGALRRLEGRQVYELPAGIDPAAYDGLYVWCEKFSVPLGYAAFE